MHSFVQLWPPDHLRTLSLTCVAVALAILAGCATSSRSSGLPKTAYPVTAKTNQVEVYHGVTVTDPYRWLEDDRAAATMAWVEQQNALTRRYLDAIPGRPAIQKRLTELWNYERYSTPAKRGGRYFFSRNSGLQNQSVLYTTTSLDADPKLLLDPNTLSADGTVALSGTAVSEDGKWLAYGLAVGGSDWQEWHVRSVETGQDLPDLLRWVKFSGASWTKDNRGFFYSRYDEPTEAQKLTKVNEFQKLYYHRLGTDQGQDTLVYHRPDQKEWGFAGQVTDDGQYLIITVSQGTDPKNRVFYKDLGHRETAVVELLTDFDASYDFVDNDGPVFWFKTDLQAPRGRVIAIDTRNPARDGWREIIPQTPETLQSVSFVGDRFFANYLKDAHSQIEVFGRDGILERRLELPGIGSAGGFSGRREDTETFYQFTSFSVPGRIYQYSIPTGGSRLWRQPQVTFDPDGFETCPPLHHPSERTPPERVHPDPLVRLRRVQHQHHAQFQCRESCLDGDGGPLCRCHLAGRRGVRRRLASSRHQAAETKRL
jgi:prolyl oligopeptidase